MHTSTPLILCMLSHSRSLCHHRSIVIQCRRVRALTPMSMLSSRRCLLHSLLCRRHPAVGEHTQYGHDQMRSSTPSIVCLLSHSHSHYPHRSTTAHIYHVRNEHISLVPSIH